ncbi:MAG TPA: CopG family antitoxin [Thermoanaerobaculia bacterium]|jgi:hypothetical protein
MARSKGESLLTGSVDELVRFFDAHDMGAHWDEMPEVHFDVDIKRRAHLVAVDDDLVDKIAEVARTKHVSSESLINALLREKLAEAI